MIRFFDIVFSLLALIILSPLLIIVSLVLLGTGEHYIFYFQKRIGRSGKVFSVFKFATMLKDSPNMQGGLLTRDHDPRVLPFGSFLRKTKINELPQLLNILFGSMSFVGPRPQAPEHYALYTDEQQKYISQLTPGLTGVGSLIFRDEEGILARSEYDFDYTHDKIITPYKGELETWYYHHRNLGMYFRIILFTAIGMSKKDFNATCCFSDLPKIPEELKEIIC